MAAAGTAIFWEAEGVVSLVLARVVQGIATGAATGALAAGLVEFSPRGSPHSGPKFVYFILVSQGIDWKPYLPPEPTPIGPMVQRVASDRKMALVWRLRMPQELWRRSREPGRSR